jgi:hypothetical protein
MLEEWLVTITGDLPRLLSGWPWIESIASANSELCTSMNAILKRSGIFAKSAPFLVSGVDRKDFKACCPELWHLHLEHLHLTFRGQSQLCC